MAHERILVVDDEVGMREYLMKLLSDSGYSVCAAEDSRCALEMLSETPPDLALVDMRMPKKGGMALLEEIKKRAPHVVVAIMTAYGTTESAVQAMKLGAYDYIRKPFEVDDILHLVDKALEKKRLQDENLALHKELEKSYTFEDIVSKNASMHKVFEVVRKVADTRSTILVRGETGTGKELIARALHNLSGRREKPFIPVDCATLSETLLESELFGHVKGAFTGATADKKGLFEVAEGGTIFLDEVGHVAPEMQAKLLRVLQDGQVKRVGEAVSRRVDVRLIAATNEDLEAAIPAGRFREDLYYRLNVVPILIPPLRERKEDIPLLVDFFIRKYNRLENKDLGGMDEEALKVLFGYDWPGNVRELENLVHRAVVMEKGERIAAGDLPENICSLSCVDRRDAATRTNDFHNARQFAIESFEKRFLTEALKRHQGNVSHVAREIGLDRRNLQKKFKSLGIDPSDFHNPS